MLIPSQRTPSVSGVEARMLANVKFISSFYRNLICFCFIFDSSIHVGEITTEIIFKKSLHWIFERFEIYTIDSMRRVYVIYEIVSHYFVLIVLFIVGGLVSVCDWCFENWFSDRNRTEKVFRRNRLALSKCSAKRNNWILCWMPCSIDWMIWKHPSEQWFIKSRPNMNRSIGPHF